MTTSNNKNSNATWGRLRDAGLIQLAKWAAAFVVAYGLMLAVTLIVTLWKPETAGQFGDAFGMLTSLFNALAFAGVVATIVMQGQELEESRKQLEKQSAAQDKWATAANTQIEVMKQLESLRLRPVIKVEWERSRDEPNVLTFWMRNVGSGPAVVNQLDLTTSPAGDVASITENNSDQSRIAWTNAIALALTPAVAVKHIALYQLSDANRALASSERQILVAVTVADDKGHDAYRILRRAFAPVIHFVSVDNKHRTTANQFDDLRQQ